jgi:hypothetical protein
MVLKHRLLVAVSAVSIAALSLTPFTYAHEAQPNDDRGRGRQEVQVNDDRGADQLMEVQAGDDQGIDAARHDRRGDDHGVDPQPHA